MPLWVGGGGEIGNKADDDLLSAAMIKHTRCVSGFLKHICAGSDDTLEPRLQQARLLITHQSGRDDSAHFHNIPVCSHHSEEHTCF